MTGQIIPLHADEHREVQLLLPWYATSRLDAQDHARVEAHLGACAECQADLALERQMAAAVANLPLEAQPPWEALKTRLPRQARQPARHAEPRPAAPSWVWPWSWRPGPQTMGWALAGQFAMLLLLGAVLVMRPGPTTQNPGQYQALGAAPAPAAGNLVVIFRPDIPEKALRAILTAINARLVDGPTAADAYVLHVAPAERAAILTKLRARREIVLAEPIDAGGKP